MTSQNERILLAHNVQPDSRWYGSTLWGNVVAVCRNSSQLESTPLQHKQAGMVYSLKWTRRLIFEFSRTLAYTIVDWRNAGVDAQRQRENLYNYRRRNNNTINNTNLSGFFLSCHFWLVHIALLWQFFPCFLFFFPPAIAFIQYLLRKAPEALLSSIDAAAAAMTDPPPRHAIYYYYDTYIAAAWAACSSRDFVAINTCFY